MPEIIRGHTHAPSVLIGEKAAALVHSAAHGEVAGEDSPRSDCCPGRVAASDAPRGSELRQHHGSSRTTWRAGHPSWPGLSGFTDPAALTRSRRDRARAAAQRCRSSVIGFDRGERSTQPVHGAVTAIRRGVVTFGVATGVARLEEHDRSDRWRNARCVPRIGRPERAVVPPRGPAVVRCCADPLAGAGAVWDGEIHWCPFRTRLLAAASR